MLISGPRGEPENVFADIARIVSNRCEVPISVGDTRAEQVEQERRIDGADQNTAQSEVHVPIARFAHGADGDLVLHELEVGRTRLIDENKTRSMGEKLS